MKIEPWNDDRLASNGRPIKENFAAWFRNGQVVDSNGDPLRVHHATDVEFSAFEFTQDIGFHFGSVSTVNARSEQADLENAHIVSVFLSLQNPLRVDDLHTWAPNRVVSELEHQGILTAEEADEADDWEIGREQVQAWLKAKGYDGIVYANVTEGGGDSYIVFDPTQIKSAIGNSGLYNMKSGALLDPCDDVALRVAAAADDLDALRCRLPEGVCLKYRVNQGGIYLDALSVRPRGTGIGTAVLQEVVDIADRNEISLQGTVDPTDDPEDPDTNDLLRWYARFGFNVTGIDSATEQPLIERGPFETATPIVLGRARP